jgi:periplasmic divalent cation tolerance protein
MNKYIMVFSSFPSSDIGKKVARVLIQEKLAACVNIIPGIQSVFLWEEQMHEAHEAILLIKTLAEKYKELEKKILELHPYACPEVIAMDVKDGNTKFLNWVQQAVK